MTSILFLDERISTPCYNYGSNPPTEVKRKDRPTFRHPCSDEHWWTNHDSTGRRPGARSGHRSGPGRSEKYVFTFPVTEISW